MTVRTAGSSTDWASSNKVWTTPGLALKESYLDILTGDYGSPLAEVDFASDPDAARGLINDWVADNTNDLIPELWPSDSFSHETVMVLVNAVALDAPTIDVNRPFLYLIIDRGAGTYLFMGRVDDPTTSAE